MPRPFEYDAPTPEVPKRWFLLKGPGDWAALVNLDETSRDETLATTERMTRILNEHWDDDE